jgi:hypothetical protein
MKEEDKRKSIYTPGFFDDINRVVFEQLKDQKYAISPNAYPKPPTEGYGIEPNNRIGDMDYFPCEILPWEERLVEKPLMYGTVSELQKEVRHYILDHSYLTENRLYDVLVAWTFHTYIPEVFDAVPYLWLHGPRGTGKTRLSDTLCELSFRGLSTPDTSEAALFRCMEFLKPTLFIDENSNLTRDVKAAVVDILNSGYKRGGLVMRCNDQGDLKYFRVFGPKCINGTRPIHDTLESRCIPVRTIKNLRKVRNTIDRKWASELRAKLLMWRFTYLESWRRDTCATCVTSLEAYDGRIQELYTPLLTVANDGKESILSFVEGIAAERAAEDLAGIDAEIVGALANLTAEDLVHDDTREPVVLNLTLEGRINKDRSEQDKLKNQTIGRLMKRLGFTKRRVHDGRGWFYDESLVKDLKRIYYPSERNDASDTSDTSGTEKPHEVCKFCGKPIVDNVHDFVFEDNKDYPAHLDCARQWRETKANQK